MCTALAGVRSALSLTPLVPGLAWAWCGVDVPKSISLARRSSQWVPPGEAFRQGGVVAVAVAADRGHRAGLGEPFGAADGQVLHTAVAELSIRCSESWLRCCIGGSPTSWQAGSVASVEDKIRQAEVMRRCRVRVPAPRSSFAGYRFPPEVILVAVRWYLPAPRGASSYPRCSREELEGHRQLGRLPPSERIAESCFRDEEVG
jgi:hypothetical protein